MPTNSGNTPSEENPYKKGSTQQPNAGITPARSSSTPQSSPGANKQKGVTGLLRDIFKRNAAHPDVDEPEDEFPAFTTGGAQPSNKDPNIHDDQALSEAEANPQPIFLDDVSGKPPQTGPLSKDKSRQPDDREKGEKTRSTPAIEENSQEKPDSPRKGLNSFFTGILRNSGSQDTSGKSQQEGAIDDRLSDIFQPPAEDPANESWEDKFLSTIMPHDDANEESDESGGSSFEIYEKNYLTGLPKDDDDDDYIFQEWTGFSKSFKDKPEAPPISTNLPQSSEEFDPMKLLPSHSLYGEEDEEALIEEQTAHFKEKNSFLYVPNQNQEPISLEEMRQVVLENGLANTASPEKRKKRISVDKSTRSFRNLKWGEIAALSVIGILVIAVAISSIFLFTRSNPTAAPAVTTPTVVILDPAPSPVGIQITGGWYFPLSKNTMVDGRWKPKSAEWLEGSDIRRIVTLTWNKQLEAAIKTLAKGDEIELNFNNNERIVYQVEKVEQLPVDKTNVGSDLVPSLLVILYDENSPNRWVITCLPK